MNKVGKIFSIIGGILGSGCIYLTSDFSLEETFTGDGLSDTLTESADSTTVNPEIILGTTLMAPIITTIDRSSGGPEPSDIVGFIIKKNAMPYTKLERKATYLRNIITGEGEDVNKKTAFIAETKEGCEMLSRIIDADSFGKGYDTLRALEKVLAQRVL